MIFETVLLPIATMMNQRGYGTARPDSGSELILNDFADRISSLSYSEN